MKHLSRILVLAAVVLLGLAPNTSAQLLAASEAPVAYGHHHVSTANVEAQKKFLVDSLGGTAIKVGANNLEIVKFPNVLIFFRTQGPLGARRGRRPTILASPCRTCVRL